MAKRQRKIVRRPSFECLERRRLLTAVAPVPSGFSDTVTPPALVGSGRPHTAEIVDLVTVGAAASAAAFSTTAPDVSVEAMWRPTGPECHTPADRPAFSDETSTADPPASLMLLTGNSTTPGSSDPSAVVSHSLIRAYAGPQVSYVAPASPVIAAIAVDVQHAFVSVVFVTVDSAPIWSSSQVADSGTYADVTEVDYSSPAAATSNATPALAGTYEVGHPAMLGKTVFDTSPPPMTVTNSLRGPSPTSDANNTIDPPPVTYQDLSSTSAPSQTLDVSAPALGKPSVSQVTEVAPMASGRKTDLPPDRVAALGTSSVAVDGGGLASSAANPQTVPTNRDTLLEASATGTSESGFITIDLASAALRSDSSATGALSDGSSDALSGQRFSDLSLGSRVTAGQAAEVDIHSTKLFTSDSFGPVHSQGRAETSQDGDEVEVIDLADGSPAAVAAASAASAAGDAADAVQDASVVRSQSGAGLFCDMEVAVGSLPGNVAESALRVVDRASAAAPNRQAVLVANPPREVLRRLTPRQRASTEPADKLPLFLGAAVIVLTGGIRLQDSDQDRQRRLQNIQRSENQQGE